MPGQAKVEDLEIFRVFRAAMVKFVQSADQALSGADSDIARTRSWLEGEQRVFWETQLRNRAEAVSQAKEAVRRKKLYKDATGRQQDASQEEKHLSKCLRALEQAEEKIAAIRKSIPKLEKEGGLYRSGVARFSGTLTGDIPKALALLDRLADRLEEYIQMTAPVTSVTDSSATGFESSITRSADPAPPADAAKTSDTPPPETSPSPPFPIPNSQFPSPSADPSTNTERPHVADGQ